MKFELAYNQAECSIIRFPGYPIYLVFDTVIDEDTITVFDKQMIKVIDRMELTEFSRLMEFKNISDVQSIFKLAV